MSRINEVYNWATYEKSPTCGWLVSENYWHTFVQLYHVSVLCLVLFKSSCYVAGEFKDMPECSEMSSIRT